MRKRGFSRHNGVSCATDLEKWRGGIPVMATSDAPGGLNPDAVQHRTLYTGTTMPAVGLGAFGSDRLFGRRGCRGRTRRHRAGISPHRFCGSLWQRGAGRRGTERRHGRGRSAGRPLDHVEAVERQTQRGRCCPLVPSIIGVSTTRLSRPLPRTLAFPELPRPGL